MYVELTPLERSEHIAEWVRLTEQKKPAAQVAPLEIGYGKPPPQKAGGINAATRELGINRTEAKPAVQSNVTYKLLHPKQCGATV